jgi:hypothetical protein
MASDTALHSRRFVSVEKRTPLKRFVVLPAAKAQSLVQLARIATKGLAKETLTSKTGNAAVKLGAVAQQVVQQISYSRRNKL